MRVLLASHSIIIDHHRVGGLERWMSTFSGSLRARGHDCDLFFFAEGPLRLEMIGGHQVYRGDLAALMEWVSQVRPEIVHAKTLDWFTGISVVRLLPHQPRLVLTHHGTTSHNWNSSNCDALVGCSRWGAEEQRRSSDLEVDVALNGINLADFQPAAAGEGPPIIGWVGRAGDLAHKRIDRLAAIAPGLTQSGLRIWIADPDGPDSLPPKIRETLLRHVERWEKVPPETISEFYRTVAGSGGLVISTSDLEGLPLALIEAQACGCPVVGTHVRGVEEAVSTRGGGILFPPDIGPEPLRQLITSVVLDGDGMAMRRREARLYAESHFSLERMTSDYLEIYARTLRRERPRSRGWIERVAGVSHREFVAENWLPGHRQWAASQELARREQWELAAIALQGAVTTYPHLAVKPTRLPHIVRTIAHRPSDSATREGRREQSPRVVERKP